MCNKTQAFKPHVDTTESYIRSENHHQGFVWNPQLRHVLLRHVPIPPTGGAAGQSEPQRKIKDDNRRDEQFATLLHTWQREQAWMRHRRRVKPQKCGIFLPHVER